MFVEALLQHSIGRTVTCLSSHQPTCTVKANNNVSDNFHDRKIKVISTKSTIKSVLSTSVQCLSTLFCINAYATVREDTLLPFLGKFRFGKNLWPYIAVKIIVFVKDQNASLHPTDILL